MIENVKISIIASFASRFSAAILSIIVVPIYIKILGIESYGIIGFFTTLQALATLFDFGIGTTIIKEFSSKNDKKSHQKLSDLAKASEFVYIIIACFIFLVLYTSIPWIVNSWINIGDLSKTSVTESLLIASLALSIQWPATLYASGLAGLHKQLQLASYNTGILFLRVISIVIVLKFVSPTIKYFFIVNLIFSLIQFIVMRHLMWSNLPKPNNWGKSKDRLIELKGFIGTMSAISVCSVLLTQLDKIILSNILTLKDFGVYSLVVVFSGGLYLAVSPIFSVIYPRLSSIVSSGSPIDVIDFYHKSCQLLSMILIPIAVIVSFFSEKILFVWTGDITLSSIAKWPLILLVIGNALNGMMNAPYALQLAYSKPKLALYSNVISILFLIPSIYYLAKNYGVIGGAFAWLVINILYVLASQYITHRHLLKSDLFKWYWTDVGLPLLACALNVYALYLLTPNNLTRLELLLYLTFVFFESLVIVILLLPEMRRMALTSLMFSKLGR
ncbi:MAG: oligosaccharide flippase family protein [Methylotenera sp.]|nr:oligosaccharide flippase family protein [Methylotenera sp.]MDP3060374.1 oligosaccharide flippase family protein [Methylotenera sp.]